MVRESIDEGMQWAVFEPNDQPTCGPRSSATSAPSSAPCGASGALFGSTPDQAFYVKCDAETNPPEVRDAGQLICEIGMCPVKPAEFVIFRIGQMPSGGDVAE
jgi:phage tail sheath protein FI